jgi:hypothetical protein
MMEWNYDMDAAPRGIEIEHKEEKLIGGKLTEVTSIDFTPQRVWIANHDGNVYATYWVRETKRFPGHWSGFTANEPGLAWMPYVKPTHPNKQV